MNSGTDIDLAFIAVVASCLVFAITGTLVGRTRTQSGTGLFLGAFLGPIGCTDCLTA